jgi:hypothetical protein
MRLPTWLIQRPDARMTFLCGGTASAVRQLLTGPDMPPLLTICDRATAEHLVQAAVLEGEKAPDIMVSRGFRQDCETLIAAPSTFVTLIDASVFTAHLQATRGTLASRAQLLGGYDVPASVVARVAMACAWQHADATAHRLPTPVLIHINKNITRPAGSGRHNHAFTMFEFPDSQAVSDHDYQDVLGHVTATPSSDVVLAHAKFLINMDLNLLCTLHSPLAVDREHLIFSFWHETLSNVIGSTETVTLIAEAQAKLAAVRTRILCHPTTAA